MSSRGVGFGPTCVRATRILYIEGDDGTVTLENIPGISQQDKWLASLIVTDKGRVLKDRSGIQGGTIPSFDLVKNTPEPKKKTTKTKPVYRSIFDPIEISDEQ